MTRGQWLQGIRAAWSRPALALRAKRRSAFSTKPDDIKPEASQKTRSRIVRITSRLPRFLQGFTTPLINAPLTHISAFLILHELTAIIPLFGLTATFHYTKWMPPFIGEGKWVSDGVEKFGNYFRKKGWLGEEGTARRYRWWGRGEGGTRIVVELATAYAITKALMPIRVILSVSATPWFARVAIVPSTNLIRRMFTKRKH
ncbi:MAG: hypothetical protein Q9161_009476 [Pseudevernia consocians]